MGLAAGQARLLTITARKSDCEFQSMTLSHQKIALSRELADISNEYQNSLTKTKLFYDYYGTGDQTSQLNYMTHLMSPSVLNDYMPTLITDTSGRAVLNSKYAAAARRAGIPQEGLGTLPSEAMRNLFVEGLQESGLITTQLKDKIQGLPYNQQAGFGGGAVVVPNYQSGDKLELAEYLDEIGASITITTDKSMVAGKNGELNVANIVKDSSFWESNMTAHGDDKHGNTSSWTGTYSLGDILKGDKDAMITAYVRDGGMDGTLHSNLVAVAQDAATQIAEQLGDILDLGDGATATAIQYALDKTIELYSSPYDSFSYKDSNTHNRAQYLGLSKQKYVANHHHKTQEGFSLSGLLESYLTYFEDYINGVAKTDVYGRDLYSVNQGIKANSNLVTNDDSYIYRWSGGREVSSDDLAYATFYDALFNQICANGWTENTQIDDNEYLQQMLQNGMMFLSKPKDDHYYYQQNYATDTYIKEIADESFIAQAEAKYATEKAKLNSKEETIDLKMKNLDTEISSLTTEYDTVKNTISKNIEKSFKRYNA